jgi:predicted Co/Zn/Cd cation transporter (cation efflux family)
VAASLLMAAMGISVYALSGSEALLLDGLLSGVMAASSFITDRAYPYGYDGQEALYVLFRSLVLIGILSFAVITAGTTIVNHLAGQAVAAVQLRPVATYAGLMVVLCLALRQSAGATCDSGLIARTRDAGGCPLDRSAAGADRRALRRTPGPRAHRSDPHGAGAVDRMTQAAGS